MNDTRRPFATVALLILHSAAAVLAGTTLLLAWEFRSVLQILYRRIEWFPLLSTAMVLTLAVVEVGRTVSRGLRRQPERNAAVRLRVAFYVSVACLLLCVFVLSFRAPVIAQMTVGFAYAAYVLWSRLLPRLQRAVPPGVRRGLDLVCMNATLAVVFAEIGLQAFAIVWPSPLLVRDSTPHDRRRAAESMPAGTILYDFPINSGGHYDTEFVPRAELPGSLVVSIGDSFSYGRVPHPFHFTTVSERELPGVEFYNMGFQGASPSDYRHLLVDDALPLRPDLVVVQLFLGNDVVDGPAMDPLRWYDADRYLTGVLWQRLRILRRERLLTRRKTEAAGESPPSREELVARHPWLGDPLVEDATFSEELFLDIESQRARMICISIQGIYERFFATLEDLERTAGSVPLAFVLIPDEFQLEDDLWDEVVRRVEEPLERDRPQRMIVEWLGDRGRPVLDLLPLMRAVEPLGDGRRHLYHLQDTHFNVRGNDVAGRALARFVSPLLNAAP